MFFKCVCQPLLDMPRGFVFSLAVQMAHNLYHFKLVMFQPYQWTGVKWQSVETTLLDLVLLVGYMVWHSPGALASRPQPPLSYTIPGEAPGPLVRSAGSCGV